MRTATRESSWRSTKIDGSTVVVERRASATGGGASWMVEANRRLGVVVRWRTSWQSGGGLTIETHGKGDAVILWSSLVTALGWRQAGLFDGAYGYLGLLCFCVIVGFGSLGGNGVLWVDPLIPGCNSLCGG